MMQHSRNTTPRPPPRRGPGRAFATSEAGDISPRAPSDRTVSEYMIANERLGVREPQPSTSRGGGGSSYRDNHSDIYAQQQQGNYRAPSEYR